jgi:hypothetical protein
MTVLVSSRQTRKKDIDTEDLVSDLPTHDDVRVRVNSAFDKLFVRTVDGEYRPYVCCVCDEIIDDPYKVDILLADLLYFNRVKVAWKTYVKKQEHLIPAVMEYYQVTHDLDKMYTDKLPVNDFSWLCELALSPNSSVIPNKRGHNGLSCCSQCKRAVKRKDNMHYYKAIANYNFVGVTPKCLSELTEVELALVSPVRSHGYCFSYIGGKQRNLRGSLVYLRVKRREVVRGMMELEALGLTKNILIIAHGPMTADQQKIIKEKTTIRSDKVISAVEWLCKNNMLWKDTNIDDIREQLEGLEPTIIDKSRAEDSVDSNVEKSEIFSCYFPDGATNEKEGGFHEKGAFKDFVEQMQENNTEIEFVTHLQSEFVDHHSDEFLEACLLQFPYGIGGMKQRRIRSDGSYTRKKTDLEAYIKHLSKVSQPVFQRPLFTLMLYNLHMKQKLLDMAFLQVPEKIKASSIADGLTVADLTQAAEYRKQGMRNYGTQASRTLLQAVDACSRAVPHTDQASKNARFTAECFQHHFGMPSIFLTVTYDDDNSFLLQVLSNTIVDDDTDVYSLSDEDVEDRVRKRKSIRIQYPGLAAMSYQMLNKILFKEVIGWDSDTNSATEKPGLFGRCTAVALAVEEQGRKTLHGHITIWIEGFSDLQNRITQGKTAKIKRDARKSTCEYINHVTTTELFGPKTHPNSRTLEQAFQHECYEKDKFLCSLPQVVEDQQLRNLRHKHGYRETNGKFAECLHCLKQFTYEDLIAYYAVNVLDVQSRESRVLQHTEDHKDIPLSRMKTMCVQYQRTQGSEVSLEPFIINATCNHHISCHVRGCFSCSKEKNHICSAKCECRFRLPDRPRKSTKNVQERKGGPVKWYTWTGVNETRTMLEFMPTRNEFDLFQNVNCKAITLSKFTCNNNISVMTPGPIMQYQFKYIFKSTQKDDTGEYDFVLRRIISCISERKHEDDRKEARRRIITAAFAHQKKNIIGCAMASYIIMKDSRFYFSHEFVYCPLNDLVKLLYNDEVGGCMKTFGTDEKVTFFENAGLHYLCRNSVELEEVSVAQFFTEYRICANKPDDDDVYPMEIKTKYYHHPAGNERRKKMYCAATPRQEVKLLQISQWTIPDTGHFAGDLLHSANICAEMERYSMLVLVLFMPFRGKPDLQVEGAVRPYTQKLRQVFAEDDARRNRGEPPKVFTDFVINYLQNIQDARSNCLRVPTKEDDLQSRTEQYDPLNPDVPFDRDEEEQKSDEFDIDLEKAFEWMHESEYSDEIDDGEEHPIPKKYMFSVQRDTGKRESGYNDDLLPLQRQDINSYRCEDTLRLQNHPFIYQVQNHQNQQNSDETSDTNEDIAWRPETYSRNKIMELMFRTREVNSAAAGDLFGNRADDVMLANGSAHSIINWAELAGLDAYQKRAFELITAAFVLTFHAEPDDVSNEDRIHNTFRARYHTAYEMLKDLYGIQDDSQLICLLHGPGGSGKSTVIDLVKAYSKEFCKTLGHEFNSRTIVVTAMSGVAATLINGETAHKAFGMMKKSLNSPTKKKILLKIQG